MPLVNTFIAIANSGYLTSGNSYTFSSIPQTYSDLMIRHTVQSSGGSNDEYIDIQLNGDTAANYSNCGIRMTSGTITNPFQSTTQEFGETCDTNATFYIDQGAINYWYFPNYSTAILRNMIGGGTAGPGATYQCIDCYGTAVYNQSAAITSITCKILSSYTFNNSNLSRLTLYGIKRA